MTFTLAPAQEIAVAFRGEAKTVKFYPGHEAQWFFAGLTRGDHDALKITDEEAREIEARVRKARDHMQDDGTHVDPDGEPGA